jgi:hypothetical protein
VAGETASVSVAKFIAAGCKVRRGFGHPLVSILLNSIPRRFPAFEAWRPEGVPIVAKPVTKRARV